MRLIEYADREVLAMDLANLIAGELKNALLSHDTVSFAVPGGTTPGPIFDSLSAANLDWARVQVMLGDERWVAPDHEMSNARLLRNRLLVGRAAEAAFTPFYIDGLTSAEAAETLSPQIEVDGQDIGRITLSRRVLEGAMSKHLVIFGDEKRASVEQAQSLPALQAPIGAVLNEATVHWAP